MSVNGSNTLRRLGTKSSNTGAIDEEGFRHSFSTVSSLPIYSSRDLSEYMTKIKDSVSAHSEDWERRVNGLKDLRNVVASGGHQMDDFPALLRTVEAPVLSCIQDLRSQVVREACITVAYLSQEIGGKFDHFAEVIMQPLLNLILNSAKIMSTSAITAISIIIRHTFASRVLPIIIGGLQSKSNVVRKNVCIFLNPIFQYWPVHVIERHMGIIQEALRKGVADADQDARSATRTAFKTFADKFPDQVEPVLRNMDPAKRRAIERSLASNGVDDQSSVASGTSSRTTSQTSLATAGLTGTVKRTTRPAMGTSGLGNTARRPTVTGTGSYMSELARKNLGAYGEARSRMGAGKVSVSQPASRETSPLRTPSEVDFNTGSTASNAAKAYAKTVSSTLNRRKPLGYGTAARAPRKMSRSGLNSQGASREGSPSSAVSATAPYNTYSAAGTVNRPSLTSMSDAGFAQFKGAYSRRQYESDDNASETSSMCSERSGQSMPIYRRNQMRPIARYSVPRTVEGIGDIIKLLSSSQWSEKKDGLLNLKEYLRSGQSLSHQEVVRVAEVLSVIFGESSSKVITPFMETLQLFIKGYNQYLHEWVYIAMVRLFNRQGQEVLSTHQKSISDTLAVIRSHFPLNLLFACCCRFIIDDAMSPTLKVKGRVLDYLKDLLVMMPVDTISNPTPEMVKSVIRIITWSTEPKSADVRRLASRVVIKLSHLNPAAFSSMVQMMPKASQDQAAKLLKTYAKTSTAGNSGVSYDATSPDGARTTSRLPKPITGNGTRPFSPITETYVPSVAQEAPVNQFSPPGGPKNRSVSIPDTYTVGLAAEYGGQMQAPPPPPYSANLPMGGQNGDGNHHYFPVAACAGNMNSVPQYGQQNSYPPGKSPQQQQPQSPFSGMTNDLLYPKLKKPVIGYQTLKKIREMPPEDAITEILQELSNYNDRYEQRKACMLKLIKLLRDGTIQTWEEHSKPTLLILLESLSDTSSETRALALRVLQELVRTQGELISDYACLTVMKILEACNDTDKGVNRSAEECAQAVARYLSQELMLRLLTTVINDSQTSLNLPAVKMQTQVIKVSSPDLVQDVLPDLIPGLIAACNHENSQMRKASIFCLVQIAIKFGDAVWDYLSDLNASKKRLLRIYIDKELEGQGKSSESVRISGNIPIS
nr:CLIP associating protein 1 [Hymenolepis microstoma]